MKFSRNQDWLLEVTKRHIRDIYPDKIEDHMELIVRHDYHLVAKWLYVNKYLDGIRMVDFELLAEPFHTSIDRIFKTFFLVIPTGGATDDFINRYTQTSYFTQYCDELPFNVFKCLSFSNYLPCQIRDPVKSGFIASKKYRHHRNEMAVILNYILNETCGDMFREIMSFL